MRTSGGAAAGSVGLRLVANASAAAAAEGKFQSYDHEDEHQHGYIDSADYAPAVEPDLTVPAEGLEGAPEAVGHVEPQGDEADEVDNQRHGILESKLDKPCAGSGRDGFTGDGVDGFEACDLGKLHLSPELIEVDQKECKQIY